MPNFFNKETQLCISISQKPGNFGSLFHNFLYQKLNLNFVYKSCGIEDIEGAIRGVRALGIRGCGISMPFKESAMAYVDELDPTAKKIGAINTIVNSKGSLFGTNTDFLAMVEIFRQFEIPKNTPTVLLGSGGMAKAVGAALAHCGFQSVVISSRNSEKGKVLAGQFGYTFDSKISNALLLINATSIGMNAFENVEKNIPFSQSAIQGANWVVDVVAAPIETFLVKAARQARKVTVTGFDITTIQAIRQFELYTGVKPTADQFEGAKKYCLEMLG